MLPAQPNQSLIEGLHLLEAVLAAKAPVGIRELSRDFSLNRTRVNRLLMTLSHLGLLARTQSGKYQPGTAIHVLAALGEHGSGLLQAAMPHARQWWQRGFSITLGVLWHDRFCHILHARPELPFETAIGGHGLIAPQRSAAGLALSLRLPNLRKSLLASPLPDNLAVTSLRTLLNRAQKTRYILLPFQDGTRSVGVPLGTPPIAGISVSHPRLPTSQIPSVVKQLRQTAASILHDASAPRGSSNHPSLTLL